MDATQPGDLAVLRAVVGYLGEKNQYNWWPSSFCAPTSHAFLTPVFARTPVLAQCTGVTTAAAVVHDRLIGIGRVYHLFRLPEDLEQAIHRALYDPDLCTRIVTLTSNKDTALAHLRAASATTVAPAVGPALIGDVVTLRSADAWSAATAHYLQAFAQNAQIYPYFVDKG